MLNSLEYPSSYKKQGQDPSLGNAEKYLCKSRAMVCKSFFPKILNLIEHQKKQGLGPET